MNLVGLLRCHHLSLTLHWLVVHGFLKYESAISAACPNRDQLTALRCHNACMEELREVDLLAIEKQELGRLDWLEPAVMVIAFK